MKKILFVLMVLVLAFTISCTPQVEHKHTNIEKVLDKEPTNKEEGRYQYVCKDCKEVVSTEVISKLNYPAEIFVPEGTELKEMDDSLVAIMKQIVKDEAKSEEEISKIDIAYEYWISNAVFKENAVINSHVVSDGCGSIGFEMIENETKSYYIDATIILKYSDEEKGNYKIAMNFSDAEISAEWDAEESKWVNPKLADKDTFDCKIVPLDLFSATNLYPSDQKLWDFCEAVFEVKSFDTIFTEYEAEYTTIKTAKDKKDSVVYEDAFVTLFDSEDSLDFLDFYNGKVKVDGKEYEIAFSIDDAKTLNCKYFKINGEFYNPDKLNKALLK